MCVKVTDSKSTSALFNIKRDVEDMVADSWLMFVCITSTQEVRGYIEREAMQGQVLVTSLQKCVDQGGTVSYTFAVNYTSSQYTYAGIQGHTSTR